MTTSTFPHKRVALIIAALVSGLNIASATAMQASKTTQTQSQDVILLSKQEPQKETVFSPEMLAIKLKISRDSAPTHLIPGQFEETGSEFDGFQYNFN